MRKQRAFASLSEAEINQVAEWVRAQKYDDVIARVAQPRPEGFGLKVSRKPLQLLFAKVSRLEKINAHLATGTKLTLTALDQIEAGEKSDLCEEVHDAILIATHDIATNDDCNPTQLLALQRLADFPERAALRAAKEQRTQEKSERDQQMHAHKIALDLRKEARAERNTTVREAHLKLAEKKLADSNSNSNSNSKLKTKNSTLGPDGRPGDHLGPIATNWKEVGQRVCKLFNISPEEEARRAELHKTWKDPHTRPGIPEEINPVLDDNDPWSLDPASEPEPKNSHASITPSTVTPQNSVPPSTDLLITDHSPSEPSASPSSENQTPAPIAPSAPISPIDPITPNPETTTPTPLPPAPPNNLNPAQLAHFQRMEEFYKGMGAHARELHNEFVARRAQLQQENQNENLEPQSPTSNQSPYETRNPKLETP